MKRLLLITNLAHDDRAEDLYLADLLSREWSVTIANPDDAAKIAVAGGYEFALIRNAWPSRQFDAAYTELESLVRSGQLRTYNPPSKSRGFHENKTYLANLHNLGYAVIPTWTSLDGLRQAGYADDSLGVFKPLDGCSSSGLVFDTIGNLPVEVPGIYQPKIEFKFEVSLFYIDSVFEYALRSDGPELTDRWNLTEYVPRESDLDWAQKFIDWNQLEYGIERIDCVITHDRRLLLTEIEDFVPFLSIDSMNSYGKVRLGNNILESISRNFSKLGLHDRI